MALYLVQHGLSLPKEQDPEQGLSETGIAEVQRIATVARDYQIRVSTIHHSGKKRACQTAEIFAESLAPENGIREVNGLKPLDNVTTLAPYLNSENDLMLIGHLPFMERLVSLLTSGNSERKVFKFQNGGIVCLDQDPGNSNWYIKWTLMPRIE
ncbi:MAG: phosphohistidine phosphatase SixA [Proteobacteria bacterium]|nr:phosphohistidine phosphatase SixA [Pseudomonadota bacterium]MBU1454433.1 phosphohistidine phosphatase SixA [Pseudomonadota bacterium]